MSRLEKIISRFKQRPDTLPLRDIEKILLHVGFYKVSIRGSHIKYKDLLSGKNIIIPVHNKDCKAFYKQYIYESIKDRL